VNRFIYQTKAEPMQAAAYGTNIYGKRTFAADSMGRLILAPASITARADQLDIRDLTAPADQVTITGSDTQIRQLNGARDSLELYGQSYQEAAASGSILALSTIYLLPRDLAPYSRNVFVVRNTSLSVGMTIRLQIAPINDNNYYVNDGDSFSLAGGGVMAFEPTKLMRWARISAYAILAAVVNVRYFDQT